MGIVLVLGFLFFLAFAIPALGALIGGIVTFCIWLKTRKKGFWAIPLGCLILFLISMVGVVFGLLLMAGPLSYGGLI